MQRAKDIFYSPIVFAGIALGIGLVIAAVIGAVTFINSKGLDNTITVTGSAKKAVTSDQVKWTVTISRNVTAATINAGYALLAQDLKVVKDVYASNGFGADSYSVSNVFTEEVYENYTPAPDQKKYNLRQTITIQSDDLKKVEALSKNTEQIFAKGVILQANSPEYTVSALPDLRVSLLSDALSDAKARAEAISKLSNSRIGKLKTAGSGVVQVLQPGSQEVSDYGTYDTSTIDKEVMVTVRATFFLK